MPESFSLNDLFKTGTDKEQFKKRFAEAQNNSELLEEFSIFGDSDIAGSLDNIFGVADKDGDGKIDEGEFNALKTKFQDDNQDNISENDIRVMYQEAVQKRIGLASPEQMYNNAMTGVSDNRESDYVQQLDRSIGTYNTFISSRTQTSDARISKLRDEIEDIVRNTASKKGIDTAQYDELVRNAKQLQEQYNQNAINLSEKQRELDEAKREAKRVEREIKALESADEKDEVEISSRKSELEGLNSQISSLQTEVTALKANDRNFKTQLKQVNKAAEKIQKTILADDKEAKRTVDALNEQIRQEEQSKKSDISAYDEIISSLQDAREYAIAQTASAAASQDMSINFRNTGENVPSLKDVNYSAEKGQRLAQDMKSHSVGFTGYCSRHVSNGLARTGLGHERTASAHMMDTELDNNPNFRRITVSSQEELRSLPAGCVVVYEAGAAGYNKTHGHIEVTLGDGTACSDGITRNMRYSDRMSVFVPVDNA